MSPMQLYRESAFVPQATINTGNSTTAPQAFLKAFPASILLLSYFELRGAPDGLPELHLPN